MNWVKIIVTCFILAFATAVGFFGGYGLRENIGNRRIARCAASISSGELTACSPAIQGAANTLALRAAKQALDQRDETIQVQVERQIEYRYIREEREQDLVELSSVERTNACAASPAFQLRRRQLLADFAAGAGTGQPPAIPPAG